MKTVIEMAREAGLVQESEYFYSPREEEADVHIKELERFAELVRADERNSWPSEMEAMERQVNILTDALAQAKVDEREACAKVAEDKAAMVIALLNVTSQPIAIAAAIRARGSNT